MLYEVITLASELGIDACVSPRMAAASTILKFVRRGEIISLTAVEDSDSEVLEFEIKKDSGLLHIPLSELHFPRGAIIGAIVRGVDYEIPTGKSQLEEGDRVVIFALPVV